MQIGVDVHFEHPVTDRLGDLLLLGAGTAVEHQVQRLGVGLVPFFDQRLRVLEDFRTQLHVAGLVHAMHVAKRSGDREMADRGQLFVSLQDVFRLGVEMGVVGVFVMLAADAVLFAAGHAQFDLQAHRQRGHTLEDPRALAQIEFHRVLGEIEHVRTEQRLVVLLVERLAVVQQRLDPGDQTLVGMIGVQHHAHAVVFGQQMHVLRRRHRAQHLGLEAILHALAGVELRAAVGKLDDDVGVVFRRGFQHGVDRAAAGDVDRRQRVIARLGRRHERQVVFAGNDTGFELRHEKILFGTVGWGGGWLTLRR